MFGVGKCSFETDLPAQDIKNGFWVDEELNYTTTLERRFFILPHQIESIEQIEK